MNYVYKIREKKTDKVVYIGETKQPWKRWQSHVEKYGSFNRTEHYMDVLDEYVFTNRQDAFNYQCILQKEYNFISDGSKFAKSGFQLGHEVSNTTKYSIVLSNRNRIVSDETKMKMRLAKLGKPSPKKGKKYKI